MDVSLTYRKLVLKVPATLEPIVINGLKSCTLLVVGIIIWVILPCLDSGTEDMYPVV